MVKLHLGLMPLDKAKGELDGGTPAPCTIGSMGLCCPLDSVAPQWDDLSTEFSPSSFLSRTPIPFCQTPETEVMSGYLRTIVCSLT